MKSVLFILLFIALIGVIWLCFHRQKLLHSTPNNQDLSPSEVHLETKAEANFSQIGTQTNELIDAFAMTNIEQWKANVPGLKQLGGFTASQAWAVETPGRKNGISMILKENGKIIPYSAVLISVNVMNEGKLMEVKMQTPNMDIDETRELGLQLCDMLGLNPADFLAWCNRVGNHWLDTPLYDAGNSRESGSNQTLTFQILRSYDNEKPWLINFIIE